MTSEPIRPEEQRCPHGFLTLIVCPTCDPAAYERALPQVKRIMERHVAAGLPPLRSE